MTQVAFVTGLALEQRAGKEVLSLGVKVHEPSPTTVFILDCSPQDGEGGLGVTGGGCLWSAEFCGILLVEKGENLGAGGQIWGYPDQGMRKNMVVI